MRKRGVLLHPSYFYIGGGLFLIRNKMSTFVKSFTYK